MIVVIAFIRMGYVGYRLGLAPELAKLAGVVVGFFLSFRWYQGLGDLLARWSFLSLEWASAVTMVALIFLGYFGVTRGILLLEKLVQLSFQAKITKAGGLVVGLLRAAFVTSVILVVFQQLPSPYLTASIEERSLTGRRIARVAPAVYDATRPWLGHFWSGLHAPVP